ncbi:hypothetical protein V2V61_11090, partial [Streptococcus agalactiae]
EHVGVSRCFRALQRRLTRYPSMAMTLKNHLMSLLVLAPLSLTATASPVPESFRDRPLPSSDGKTWIVRSALLTDFNGGQVLVESRLFEDGKGGLVYRFDAQTEATRIYHQAACETTDATARHGDTTLYGETAAAWSCSGGTNELEESDAATRGYGPQKNNKGAISIL